MVAWICLLLIFPFIKGAVNDDNDYNSSPNANFSYSPTNAYEGDVIQFYDESYDADGYIVEWYWNFGDGSYSYQQNPSHVYSNAGYYDVTLTVTDNEGASDSISKLIYIQDSMDYGNESSESEGSDGNDEYNCENVTGETGEAEGINETGYNCENVTGEIEEPIGINETGCNCENVTSKVELGGGVVNNTIKKGDIIFGRVLEPLPDIPVWHHACLYAGDGMIVQSDPHTEYWNETHNATFWAGYLAQNKSKKYEYFSKLERMLEKSGIGGVEITTLSYIYTHYYFVAYGNVTTAHQDEKNETIEWAKSRVGRPFDYVSYWVNNTKQIDEYDPRDPYHGGMYYCAELVWAAYKEKAGVDLDEDELEELCH